MTKEASEKTRKKVTLTTRQGPSGAPLQPRATAVPTNTERTASPVDTDFTHPDLISTVREGRNFLENRLLLVPEGALVTTASLSSALFQISALAKIPREVVQAIRSVAWLLDEVEGDAVAATARDAVNSQLSYMNDELKTMTVHFRDKMSQEIGKQMGNMASTMKKSTEKDTPSPSTGYRDAILRQCSLPEGIDPRIIARVGIRARQFIIDLSAESAMQQLGQTEILDIFNKAVAKVTGEGNSEERKLRTVEKLANKGLLGEFLHDEGAKWLAQQVNADAFISALGKDGNGAQFKKRNHPVIAYYVPLNLNTGSPEHMKEIEEVNNIQAGALVNLRWIKPPARRAPSQTCGHLVLTFSDPDAANRAKTRGLTICNKRVSVSKYKKEPIRCLKCQGWNHIAAECILNVDICGTCGARGHRTSACTNTNSTHCRSCGTDDHTSWARDCPTFIRKCREYDTKHPENDLPYYPSSEPWTWATSVQPPDPSSRYRAEGGFPIRQAAPSKQLRQRKLQFRPAIPSVIGGINMVPATPLISQAPDSSRAPTENRGSRRGPPPARPFFPHPELITLDDLSSEVAHIDSNPPTLPL